MSEGWQWLGGLARQRRVAGIVLVGVLVLGACGSSSTSSSTTAATSGTTATTTPAGSSTSTGSASSVTTGGVPAGNDIGITATTIRIGVIADVATAVNPGLFQKNINVVKGWAAIINRNGGLAGRQVIVDSYDSKLDPNATTNAVIQACSKDFALVGTAALALTNTTTLDTCKNSQGQALGIPNLPGIVFGPLAQCDPDSYAISGSDESYCQTAKQNPQTYTVQAGDDKWLTTQYPNLHGVFVYSLDSPSAKVEQVPVYHADSQEGIKADGQGYFGASAEAPESALTPIVQVMKQSGSTFAQSGSTPPNVIQLIQEIKLQGVSTLKAFMCAGGCYTSYFIPTGGAAVNGMYQTLLTIPFFSQYQSNPTLDALVKQIGGINNLDSNSLSSYLEALLFQDAVQKAVANGGTLTRASLLNVLKTQETAFNPDNISGTTNVSAHGVSPCFDIVRIVNGQWQQVYPTAAGTFDCTPSNVVQIQLNENG